MKNIKESLRRMQIFILNKTIEGNKANDIKDLEGVSKAAWGFISALYKSHWDKLSVDKQNLMQMSKTYCSETKSRLNLASRVSRRLITIKVKIQLI